jgi:hypothetical protein
MSEKQGEIRKCPACGAIAETFATKCADCGTEFRNIEASQSITKLFEKLDDIEATRTDSVYSSAERSNIGLGTILKYFLFWYIVIPLKLLNYVINKSKPAKWSTTDTRKEELIMNFPVPVSREEIFEFLTLAQSKIHANTYFNALSEVTKYKDCWNKIWFKKIEQIHSKAMLSMKNDKKSLEDVNKIVDQAKQTIGNNNKIILHIGIACLAAIALIVIYFSI